MATELGKKMIPAIIIAALIFWAAPFVAATANAADKGSGDKSCKAEKVKCVEISDDGMSGKISNKESGVESKGKAIKEIPDSEVPLAGVDNYVRTVRHWSLVDLLAALSTVLVAVMMFILRRNDDEFDYRGKAAKLGTVTLAAMSVIILSTTQNFSAGMIIGDVYSIPLVALLIASIAVTVLTYCKVSVQRR